MNLFRLDAVRESRCSHGNGVRSDDMRTFDERWVFEHGHSDALLMYAVTANVFLIP